MRRSRKIFRLAPSPQLSNSESVLLRRPNTPYPAYGDQPRQKRSSGRLPTYPIPIPQNTRRRNPPHQLPTSTPPSPSPSPSPLGAITQAPRRPSETACNLQKQRSVRAGIPLPYARPKGLRALALAPALSRCLCPLPRTYPPTPCIPLHAYLRQDIDRYPSCP